MFLKVENTERAVNGFRNTGTCPASPDVYTGFLCVNLEMAGVEDSVPQNVSARILLLSLDVLEVISAPAFLNVTCNEDLIFEESLLDQCISSRG